MDRGIPQCSSIAAMLSTKLEAAVTHIDRLTIANPASLKRLKLA